MEAPPQSINYIQKDRLLLIIVMGLVGFGLIMIYSASGIIALKNYGDSFYFLKKQIIWTVIATAAMLLISKVDINIWKRLPLPLMGISSLLLLLILIPGIGSEINHARRWFRFGPLSFQPSEIAKLSVIIYLSTYLAKKDEMIRDFLDGFIPPLILVGIMFLLVISEPDLGTALVIGMGSAAMLFIGGARMSHILGLFASFLPVALALVLNIGYRRNRITAFLNPWEYSSTVGYQIVQSFLSFGKGGIFGTGIGEGRQKLFFLPEAHTDFIFAVVGEELGFVGSVSVIILFVFFLWRCFKIIRSHWGSFEGYLSAGISIFIGIQILINLCVVTGLFPTKGIALPFLSFGGTSLLTNMIMVGILYAISGRSPVKSQLEGRGYYGKKRTWVKKSRGENLELPLGGDF